MVLPLRYARVWLVLGWCLITAAVLASLLPTAHLPSTGANDKFEHSLAYAVLTLWFTGIYPRSRYVLIAVGLFAMGLAIEWAQGAMALGRHSDFGDLIANTIGIAIGMTLALLWLGGWAQRIEARVTKS